MEKYIAVVKSENGKVTKYADFASKSEADAHVATYGGFVADKPSSERVNYWVVDGETLTFDKSTADSDDAAIAASQYQRNRSPLYPPLADFADAYYWAQKGDDSKMTAYVAACAKVKSDHAKP